MGKGLEFVGLVVKTMRILDDCLMAVEEKAFATVVPLQLFDAALDCLCPKLRVRYGKCWKSRDTE